MAEEQWGQAHLDPNGKPHPAFCPTQIVLRYSHDVAYESCVRIPLGLDREEAARLYPDLVYSSGKMTRCEDGAGTGHDFKESCGTGWGVFRTEEGWQQHGWTPPIIIGFGCVVLTILMWWFTRGSKDGTPDKT